MKPQPESMIMNEEPGITITLQNKKYIWLRKGTAIFLTVALVLVLLIIGSIIYYLSSCQRQEIPTLHPKYFPTEKAVFLDHYATHSIEKQEIATEINKEPKVDYSNIRLSPNILPSQYDLRFIPFLNEENNFTFNGFVNISIDILEQSTDVIKLHAVALELEGVPKIFRVSDNLAIPIIGYDFDDENQFLVISLKQKINPDKYYLEINFIGVLNDLMVGFYRSSYIKDDKVTWIAASQFQPTDARRAFPCFDEPGMKARFRISVARPPNMTTLSNMNLDTSENVKISHPELPTGYQWDIYNNSEKMSTYLVAVAVTDFEAIKIHNNFSVWARKDAINHANYSLIYGYKVMKYFEEFFGIPYPLPKMDMLALPDFQAGAMENWGLTTFRESVMLCDEQASSTAQQKRAGTVIAHEMAHQWFGNLVTPWWWTDLWLNEGFASYVEYYGLDYVNPEFEIMSQFVVDELHLVMGLDSLETSHRISIEVHHHDEINEIFDRISYAKGAAIIRMMDHFLSRQTFRKGLTNYLNSKLYGNAAQDDLWLALTTQAHLDSKLSLSMNVKDIMDTWTLQTGYPVVFLTRNYDTNKGTLSQHRFLLTKNKTNTLESLWYIPISIATNSNEFNQTVPSLWMERTRKAMLENLSSDSWVIVNVQQTGYFRVNYDLRNWKMIYKQLNTEHKQIHELNRAQILDDCMNLARAGILDYKIALTMMSYLKNERHYVPWKAGLSTLSYLNVMLLRTGHYESFKKFVMYIISDVFDEIGLEDRPKESQLDILLRSELMIWACNLGNHKCLNHAVLLFQNWMGEADPDKYNSIPANIKYIVYCTAIRQGTDIEWDFAWKRYQNSRDAFEKEGLLGALGCSREVWILTRYLQWAVTENSGVRRQDASRVFASVATNPIGKELAFNFLRTNWNLIKKHFGSSVNLLVGIVKASVQDRNADFEKNDLIDWINKYSSDLGPATRSVKQAVEATEANIHWMTTYEDTISKWCQNFKTFTPFNSKSNTDVEWESIFSINENDFDTIY